MIRQRKDNFFIFTLDNHDREMSRTLVYSNWQLALSIQHSAPRPSRCPMEALLLWTFLSSAASLFSELLILNLCWLLIFSVTPCLRGERFLPHRSRFPVELQRQNAQNRPTQASGRCRYTAV